MKRTVIPRADVLLPILLILELLFVPPSLAADFEMGMAAFNNGDYAIARREFQSLARQGDARAQAQLGLMYFKGRGMALDHKKAKFWYHKAAEQGLAQAQYKLGFMYEKGLGVH